MGCEIIPLVSQPVTTDTARLNNGPFFNVKISNSILLRVNKTLTKKSLANVRSSYLRLCVYVYLQTA